MIEIGFSSYTTHRQGPTGTLYAFIGSTYDVMNWLETTYCAGVGIDILSIIGAEIQLETLGVGAQVNVGRFSASYNRRYRSNTWRTACLERSMAMKGLKILGNILFCLALISPMLAFSIASMIGEAEIFGVAGIIRYSWIMLFFVPFEILSILIGIKLKKCEQHYKKNLVIAFICLPLIIIFGSYSFLFPNVSYDIDKVSVIEKEIKLDLPSNVKIATVELPEYNLSYLKIVDEISNTKFESKLEADTLWQSCLSSEIKMLLPINIQYVADTFDYFVF